MCNSCVLVEKSWTSHPSNVQQARATAREIVSRYAADEAGLIELAVGEACANAVEHGSPAGDANRFILRCSVLHDQAQLVFEVEDEGRDFSLTHLTLTHVPDLLSEGGRGLFLINQIMDEVALHSTPHGLTVRMAKRLS